MTEADKGPEGRDKGANNLRQIWQDGGIEEATVIVTRDQASGWFRQRTEIVISYTLTLN